MFSSSVLGQNTTWLEAASVLNDNIEDISDDDTDDLTSDIIAIIAAKTSVVHSRVQSWSENTFSVFLYLTRARLLEAPGVQKMGWAEGTRRPDHD